MSALQLFPDQPTSVGIANALRRAKQLAEIRWTPVKPLPAIATSGVEGVDPAHIFMQAWRPQIGANYSAARFAEKYVGFNVSLETYMTALANPNSVMYTRSLHGKHRLCAAYYGTVCSQFASYVMDLPFHIDCQQWPHLDGIVKVDSSVLENLRLGDILNELHKHTAVITGIERDAQGKVARITVTESTPPYVQATSFLPKEFEAYWLKNNYEVLRYTKIDKVTYTPSPWVRLEGDPVCETPVANPVLMPDYGNKANYLLGETVTISVFDGAYTAVELSVNGEGKVLAVPEDGQLCICPDRVGYYQAVAVGDGRRSEPVEFCVVNASVTTDKKIYREQEPIKPTFSCAADDKLVGWVIKTSAFAKYWGYPHDEDGTVPESGQVPKGSYMIIALYRNNFGVYSSLPSEVFEVVAEEAAR